MRKQKKPTLTRALIFAGVVLYVVLVCYFETLLPP